jgi:hypothetical protein
MLILDKWLFWVLIKNDFVCGSNWQDITETCRTENIFAVEMIHILLNLVISGFLARFIGVHKHGGGWEEEQVSQILLHKCGWCLVTLKTLFLLSES